MHKKRMRNGHTQSAKHLIILCSVCDARMSFLLFHIAPSYHYEYFDVVKALFLDIFRWFLELCSTPRQCHRQSQIFTATRRFFQCLRECHFNVVRRAFLGAEGAQKAKSPFFLPKQTYKNDSPSFATGKNPLGPRECPGRLVTLSKCGSRARC